MEKEQTQENLEEIKNAVAKEIKKKNKLTELEMQKLLKEANENVEFLHTLDEIEIPNSGKKVIFVDGKACLVYDNGVFYVEDSMDSRKNKKKLTRKEATELYVEYFFRYIMNPAIEKKKMMEQVQKIAVKARKVEPKVKRAQDKEKSPLRRGKEDVKKEVKVQTETKSKAKNKEEFVR